MSEVASVLMRG